MNTRQDAPVTIELSAADPLAIRKDLQLTMPETAGSTENLDAALETRADAFVKEVLLFDPAAETQVVAREQHIASVESLGAKTQADAAHRSAMLKEPIRVLAARGEDGGTVANSLIDLKMQVEALDPGRMDFQAGWFTRLIGQIPGIGTPMKRYFTRFESSQTVIDAILRALEEGKQVLKRDNITLAQDQNAMRQLTLRLTQVIQLGMRIDEKLTYALDREIGPDDARRQFVEDEMVFPLRQRIQDLQQQLAVNQQGVLAIEIIIRNNKELIKGVDRAQNVTINALNVAVTVALALAHQKIVLDKIEAVNRVTDSLIASTARQLRDQGVAVQQQASTAQLDIGTLKQAFADINAALDGISRFRKSALPQMAEVILEMDTLSSQTESAIRKMEAGNRNAPAMVLDVD